MKNVGEVLGGKGVEGSAFGRGRAIIDAGHTGKRMAFIGGPVEPSDQGCIRKVLSGNGVDDKARICELSALPVGQHVGVAPGGKIHLAAGGQQIPGQALHDVPFGKRPVIIA